MFNSNNITTPGLRDWRGSMGSGALAVWIITDPWDFPTGAKEGDLGVFTPVGTPLLPEVKPIVYRLKKNVPVSATAGGVAIDMWLPPEVYAGSPEVVAWLLGDEPESALSSQGWSTSQLGTGTISPTGPFVRLQSTFSVGSEASITVTDSILFEEEFYFRGEVRGQYGVSSSIEAGFLQLTSQTPTQYAIGKTGASTILNNVLWGGSSWSSISAATILNKAGVGFELNDTWNMEVNSYTRTPSTIRTLVSTEINGMPYSTIRRGASTNISTDPFNLVVSVKSGSLTTNTEIYLRNFYVLRF